MDSEKKMQRLYKGGYRDNLRTIPTLRDKKRYIAFEVTSEQAVARRELSEEILNSAYSLFGDAGCSEVDLRLISYDGKCGIIRCASQKTVETRAALACINNVRRIRVSILVLGISGTIKGAMEKFIQQALIKEPEPDNKEQ